MRWDYDALYCFFTSAIKGDGCRGRVFVQRDIMMNELMQAVAVLLGYSTHFSQQYTWYLYFTKYKKRVLRASHKKRKQGKTSLIETIDYNGKMWCPVVEDNENFVARRNGRTFITGNTFPEQLAEDHIKSWSKEGDIILDPFSGSGTTCKIAKLLNRKYIGFDISQEYVDIAKKRLHKYQTVDKWLK